MTQITSKQVKYDKAYLRLAESWSKLSQCDRKQVGAIIVKDEVIISDGFNGTPSGFDNCCEDDEGLTHWYVLHAEANAILKVARSTNTSTNANLGVWPDNPKTGNAWELFFILHLIWQEF